MSHRTCKAPQQLGCLLVQGITQVPHTTQQSVFFTHCAVSELIQSPCLLARFLDHSCYHLYYLAEKQTPRWDYIYQKRTKGRGRRKQEDNSDHNVSLMLAEGEREERSIE